MKKIGIITSGYLPVPASKGGAVETLDEYLLKQNENEGNFEFVIFSAFDNRAKAESAKYPKSRFVFVKNSSFIDRLDKTIFLLAKKLFKNKQSSSFRYIIKRIHFIREVGRQLNGMDLDYLLFENNATLFSALRYRDNFKKYSGKYGLHLHNVIKNSFGNDKYIMNVNRVIGVSQYINSTLKLKYPAIGDSRFKVLRNSVDSTMFLQMEGSSKFSEFREKFGIKSVILFSYSREEFPRKKVCWKQLKLLI